MESKTRWRIFWLGLLTLFAVCALLPTVTSSEQLPVWFAKLFTRRVQLGLDLQGGLHIVYGVDLDKAVDDKASEIKRDFDDKLAEDKVDARVTTPLAPVGAITLTFANPADRARINEAFLSEYDEVLERRACPAENQADSVCFRVSSNYADRIKDSALDQAIETVRHRIDERGVASSEVVRKGDDIIVELPGLDEEAIERVKDIIRRTAKLEFKIVDNGAEYMNRLAKAVADDPRAKELEIAFETDLWVHDDTGNRFEDVTIRASDRTAFVSEEEAKKRGCWNENKRQQGGKMECTLSGRMVMEEYLAELLAGDQTLVVDDNHQIAFEQEPKRRADDTSPPTWRSYYLHRTVELGGSSVAQADVVWNPTTNRPEVLVTFNRFGGRRFGDLTKKNVGRKMAIILDEKVNSAPIIQSAIAGGRSTITMGGSDDAVMQREASDLVNVLRTGSLPAPLQEESSSVVGPLLGRDAVDQAKLAFILGSALVVLLMIVYYRMSGLIAIVALALNILFMLAMLAAFGATLTLPGIAAVVLTVGMAVDANIIIYERIREELRTGKSVRGAVDAGFSRAFAAILDGQLTTAAAGYVLYSYGSGPIQGFATMLIIGIVCTLFTATWCTRLLFEVYLGRGRQAMRIGI
jgi:preprotein translocase subunit SecD